MGFLKGFVSLKQAVHYFGFIFPMERFLLETRDADQFVSLSMCS